MLSEIKEQEEAKCYWIKPSKKFSIEDESKDTLVCKECFGVFSLWREDFGVPIKDTMETDEDNGIFLTFEAKADNSVLICLSQEMSFNKDKSILVCIGANGDSQTTIRLNKEEIASIPHPFLKLCSPDRFKSFYILKKKSSIIIGEGVEAGKSVLLSLRKSAELELFVPRFVAFSSWNGTNNFRDIKVASLESVDCETLNLEFFQNKVAQNVEDEHLELEKIRKRKERFQSSDDAKALQRQKRFKSDTVIVLEVLQLIKSIPTPPKGLTSVDQLRPSVVYVYGDFEGKFTSDIFDLLQQYGLILLSGRINWLHDYALNFMFATNQDSTEALDRLGSEFPDESSVSLLELSKEDEDNISELRSGGWKIARFWGRIFLLRPSCVSDVKRNKDRLFRTHAKFEYE